MGTYTLTCPVCGTAYAPALGATRCAPCDAPTIVAIDLTHVGTPAANDASLWRYFDLLPLSDRRWIVSLGEGGTPLLNAPRLAEAVDVRRLLLKNETLNPTGSFKDRQIAVGISKAKEAGATSVAAVSSGNVAAASAAYAAAAGMACHIFTPANAPEEKLVQAQMYGAAFYRVNTLSSSRVFELVAGTAARRGWHLLSTAGLYNPYNVEGAKTIAYELADSGEPLPEWILVPVGGGGLLGALWRGFSELRALGRCDTIPRLVGVQPTACEPLVRAIDLGLSPAESIATPVPVADTVAGALADDVLFDAYTALPAVRESGGTALSVPDDEMLAAETLLARTTGVFAEPASAATIAALQRLRAAGTIPAEASVCCLITGSGFKDMTSARGLVTPGVELEPDEGAFARLP